MDRVGRRQFLHAGSVGLAATGAGCLLLPASAEPTEPSGTLGEYGRLLAAANPASAAAVEIPAPEVPADLQPTEDNILGPFYRPAAPYRAKITPPLEPGDVLVIRGRVWGVDTRKPLAGATLDIWQANANGRYDNDDPQRPPRQGVFRNRARIMTDETGYYEYETIKPGQYQIGRAQWRPPHIHYLVQYPGYRKLVTQMYFQGEAMNEKDAFIKRSLIIAPQSVRSENGNYQLGTFDIVLARK
jgi:protocatechuate 3,4-dioxygenase beta subunit